MDEIVKNKLIELRKHLPFLTSAVKTLQREVENRSPRMTPARKCELDNLIWLRNVLTKGDDR